MRAWLVGAHCHRRSRLKLFIFCYWFGTKPGYTLIGLTFFIAPTAGRRRAAGRKTTPFLLNCGKGCFWWQIRGVCENGFGGEEKTDAIQQFQI